MKGLLNAIALLLIMANTVAQQGEIGGTVVDNNNEPIPGVNVSILGTTLGAQTNIDGYFKIKNSKLKKDEYYIVAKDRLDIAGGDYDVVEEFKGRELVGRNYKPLFDFYKEGNTITPEQTNLLIIGNVVAFIVALLAIKSFIGYLNKHGFKMFGWYRIVAGLIIIILLMTGHNLQII